MSNSILLVGCGRMGQALLAGWLDQGMPGSAVSVVDPQAGRTAIAGFLERGVSIVKSVEALDPETKPDIILFAIKPQAIDAIVPTYQRFVQNSPVFLSIAAGCTTSSLENLLGKTAAIVRCMPNTPAAIRLGVTVACANGPASRDQRALCTNLLEAVGEVIWIDDESLMDAVTAVSGSGPAYLFLLAEELAAAGIAAGLPEDLAEQLARRTVTGAAALLANSPLSPQQLRHNVTSPGGTTEAAMEILLGPSGLRDLMTAAVVSATARSRSLSSR
jgi:pyrroline-5-carboxylate reductase